MDELLQHALAEFQACLATRDLVRAEAVLDADFALVLVAPGHAVMPRDRWLEVLPDYVVHSYEVMADQLDRDGDVAVNLQRVYMTATVLGEDRSGSFVVSDTWRLRTDGWRLWRRHSTPMSAGTLPGVEHHSG